MATDRDRGRVSITVTRICGSSFVTTLSGLPRGVDWRSVLRDMKSRLGCNGALSYSESGAPVITLSGDWARSVMDYVVDSELAVKSRLDVRRHC